MLRTLHRDISKYNQLETAEEAQEETGWKVGGWVRGAAVERLMLAGTGPAGHPAETSSSPPWRLLAAFVTPLHPTPPHTPTAQLVHGDVFRPPTHGSWLAVLVGTGVQLFSMTLVTMVFATLGFLSPANRGGLMTAVLLLFVFMGCFAGYFSARLYKTFKVGGGVLTCCRHGRLWAGC